MGLNPKCRKVSIDLSLVFEHLCFLRILVDDCTIISPAFAVAAIAQNPFGKFKIKFLLTSWSHAVTHLTFVAAEPAISTPKTGKSVKFKTNDLIRLFQPLLLTKGRIIPLNDPTLVFI